MKTDPARPIATFGSGPFAVTVSVLTGLPSSMYQQRPLPIPRETKFSPGWTRSSVSARVMSFSSVPCTSRMTVAPIWVASSA